MDDKTTNTQSCLMWTTMWTTNTQSCLSRVAKGEEPGQPAAADMRELVWDDELEAIAQR